MKKIFLTLAAMVGLTLNASAITPGEDNGLGIRLSVGNAMGNTYLYNEDKSYDDDYQYTINGTSFGLSLDNRWYVWHNDKMGVAVQGRWLDVNFLSGTLDYDLGLFSISFDEYTTDVTKIDGGILGVGPLFTFYLNNDMAIDAYYNIMPAVNYTQLKKTDEVYNSTTWEWEDVETENNYWGVGCTHHIGAAFRWKILQAGLEARIGKMNGMKEFDSSNLTMDSSMGSLRFNLGVKF